MPDWEMIGVLVALALGVGGVLSTIFLGGRWVQRLEDMKGDMTDLSTRLTETERDLAAGKVRFATIETKLDLLLGQQKLAVGILNKLAGNEEN